MFFTGIALPLLVAMGVTIYVMVAKNPHERGTRENESLRICRIGLAFLAWSWAFGLPGFIFALVSFILGIIGLAKGRTAYGLVLILGSIFLPVLSLFFNLAALLSGGTWITYHTTWSNM